MNVLLATPDGRVGTLRTIRWSALALAPLVSVVAIGFATAAGARDLGVSFVGEAGLLMTAASLAFVADDSSADTAPATPVGLRSRLLARLAVVGPATAMAWLLVLTAYERGGSVDSGVAFGDRVVAALGIGLLSTAAALLLQRRVSVPSPGATGAAVTVAVVGVFGWAAPAGWLAALPPASVSWAVAAFAAVAVILATTREPSP